METDVAARVLGDERIDPALRARINVEIEHGSPEALLDDFVEYQHMDLTVIGSHGRGAVFDALIGSTAKSLVESLEDRKGVVEGKRVSVGVDPGGRGILKNNKQQAV